MIPTMPVMHNWGPLRESRTGIMLHYDGSSSDAGSLNWLTSHPDCRVSYNALVDDLGRVYEIAPLAKRAWHAGFCVSGHPRLVYSDGNSAFYGVAISATDGDVATDAQFKGVVGACSLIAARHGWNLGKEPWRIVGHSSEARPLGRKIDPAGSDPTKPVLSVAAVKAAFTKEGV